MTPALPPDVERILRQFRTAEFSTLARDGTPIAVPVCVYRMADGRFLTTTGIGFPDKAFNVRRDARVALSYSEPRASGLERPGAVLVQGRATCEDRIVADPASIPELAALFRESVMARQPGGKMMSSWFGRWLMPWYYMRLLTYVEPTRVYHWPTRDFAAEPTVFPGSAAASPGPAPPAPAAPAAGGASWARAAKDLATYPGAVVNARTADGEIVSVRQVEPRYDAATGRLPVVMPASLGAAEGPASVLAHFHDDDLWGLRSMLIRGRLEREGAGFTFVSTRYEPVSMFAVVGRTRRAWKAYLAKRGLQPPQVAFDSVARLWEEATALREQQR